MKKIVVALVGMVSMMSYASNLKVYPSDKVLPENKDFKVRVQDDENSWHKLYCYDVRVDSHNVQHAAMVNFGFHGQVTLAITSKNTIKTVKVRPLSYKIPYVLKGNTVWVTMEKPMDVSVEINGDIHHNLHILANSMKDEAPVKAGPDLIYLQPGVHRIDSLYMKSNQSLYLAPGAVLMGKVVCNHVKNVHIFGQGIIYQGQRGIEITFSENISVDGLIFIDPQHYTIFGGQSKGLNIKHIRSFSSRGWSDGIDLMSCTDVLIDSVFMRNSDDCIALYGHRWNYYGDTRNVIVRNSVLWADVAHPIMIGTHGNPEAGHWETLEDIHFENIDILNHNEPQIDYQGCMAINVSDENLARNIKFENIRVEDFQMGQLLNLRVTYNKKYASAPGRGIENVTFKNVSYTGRNANVSIIEGYSAERSIKNIVFDGLIINGEKMNPQMNKPKYMKVSDFARIYEGLFVQDLQYIDSSTCVSTQ